MKKKIIIPIVILIFSIFIIFIIWQLIPEPKGINTLPMYGGVDRTESQKQVDDEFVKNVIEATGSREKTVEHIVQRAWELYYKDDLDTAMKRFNQVWLLDPNNADAYFGFGIISGKKSQTDDAIKYLQKALELKPNDAEVAYNLGFAYSQKSYQLLLSQAEKTEALKNATKYFEYATQKDSSKAYYYGEWANVLYELGDYQEASKILEMAEKIDTKGSQGLRQAINAKLNK